MQQRVGQMRPTRGEPGPTAMPGDGANTANTANTRVPIPRARAYAGRPVGETPSVRSNPAAVAGAALSVIPLVGMAFSVLGLTRAQALGGAGRTVATVGLVFSVVLTVGEGVAAYELSRPTSSIADPACVSTRAEVDDVQLRLADDASALSAAQSSGDATASTSATSALVTDLRAVKSSLDAGAGRATHADVRVGIEAFDADLGTLISAVRQIASGGQSAQDELQAAEAKLRADGQSVDVLCATAAVH